ncbi:MAG: tRNA (adenosine(37)-N6)-threonylcarbamoyltransferase complex dimerization subunit type 1 TsaB, partial [Thiohalobacterales bacterium]|nr:tRNA (adenosine(37)-N6)-threonylcarbamoyltransferase complex dimerization subunit type 1 TsaB [Thiohalobacterales bacterium]
EIIPRRHSAQVFRMLEELLPGGGLVERGIDGVAFGCGPGSFTGLRIAASLAQGLAESSGLPAIPVSTLGVMAQTALREELTRGTDTVLVTLDARIDEVYAGLYRYQDGLATAVMPPWVCAPRHLEVAEAGELQVVGSGCRYREHFPPALLAAAREWHEQVLPRALDMIPLARRALDEGSAVPAEAVVPLYVQEEITWKKLGEQGKAG